MLGRVNVWQTAKSNVASKISLANGLISAIRIPHSGLFLRGKIFANFTNQVQFVKILPLKCFFSVGSLHNL